MLCFKKFEQITCWRNWELKSDVIAPVILFTQSILSASFSAWWNKFGKSASKNQSRTRPSQHAEFDTRSNKEAQSKKFKTTTLTNKMSIFSWNRNLYHINERSVLDKKLCSVITEIGWHNTVACYMIIWIIKIYEISQSITCSVYDFEGEIIRKQRRRSVSSASIFIVDVHRSTIQEPKISSFRDVALLCLVRNLPNMPLFCSDERV